MTYVDPVTQTDSRSSALRWWIGLIIVLFFLTGLFMVVWLFLQTTSDRFKQSDQLAVTAVPVVTDVPVQELLSPQVVDQRRTAYHEYGEQQSVTAQFYPEPPVPQQFQARNTEVGNSVLIEWAVPEQQIIDGVEVYRASTADAEPTLIATVDPANSSYLDQTTQTGSSYWYSVRAIRTIDGQEYRSKKIDSISILVEDIIAPASPHIDSISVAANDPLAIQVIWSASDTSDVDTFRVYRSQSNGQLGTVVAEVDSSITQLTDPTVEPGITYYYTVTAIDQFGNESSTRLPSATPGNSQPFIAGP